MPRPETTMKMTKSTTHKNAAVLTLGRAEKALWQAKTADGRDVSETSNAVRRRCRELLASGYQQVDVVAPACAGGWTWDVIYAD